MNRSSISSAEELGECVQAVYPCSEFFFFGRGREIAALLAAQWSYTFENGSSFFPRKKPPCYSDDLKVRHLPNLANHTSHPLATLINSSGDQDSNLGMNIPFLLSYSKTVLKQFSPFFPASSVFPSQVDISHQHISMLSFLQSLEQIILTPLAFHIAAHSLLALKSYISSK